MSKIQSSQSSVSVFKLKLRYLAAIAAVVWMGFLMAPQPALAHHALGGRIPSNFFEGFLSGLAHPVIGLDHLAFVVAITAEMPLHPVALNCSVAQYLL